MLVGFLWIECGIGYEEGKTLLIHQDHHLTILRHRYTASFLTLLLDNNFESPHTLLGGFINTVSEYMPYDNSQYTQEKFYKNNWYSPLGSKALSKSVFLLTIILPLQLPLMVYRKHQHYCNA